MRRLVLAAGVMVLSSCGGGNQEAVGANSPDSIVTTAVGNVVGTIPNEAATPGNATTTVPDGNMIAPDTATTNETVTQNAT